MLKKLIASPLSFKLFLIWAVGISIALPYASTHAGITEDEVNYRIYGENLYAWYFGADTTAPHTVNDPKLEKQGEAPKLNVSKLARGELFSLIAEVAYRAVFSGMDFYEMKHMLSAFFGALLFIFIGLIVQRITDSWSAALFAIIVATFTPRLFGDSLTNAKDIPFATFFTFSMLQIVSFIKEMPRIRLVRAVLLVASFAFTIAAWKAGPLAVAYLFFSVVLFFLLQYFSDEFDSKLVIQTVQWIIVISVVGYLGASLFWPWAMKNPFLNPLAPMKTLGAIREALVLPQLFEGQWLNPKDFRWYFVPRWMYITIPVLSVIGVLIFVILIPVFLRKENWRITCYALLLLSILAPVIRIIQSHLNPYDACRQFSFVVVSVLIIAILAWVELFKLIKRTSIRLSLGIFVLFLISEPILFVFSNHPLQGLYFSPLIGGAKGAFKNYEMDYYGVAVRPAFEWLEKNDTTATTEHKARVRLWYGETTKLTHFIDKNPRFKFVSVYENSTDWDYTIQMAAEAKHNQSLIYNWPPKGTVHEVKVDGAPVCAVVKNFRIAEKSVFPEQQNTLVKGTLSQLINEAIEQYNKKDYNAAINKLKKAYQVDSSSDIVINNLVAAYNALKMYDDALEWGNKGLKRNPKYTLLRNNIAEAERAKKAFHPSGEDYFLLGFNYYAQGEYRKSLAASKKCVALQPNNAWAWNNVCTAYIALQEWDNAIEAGQKALEIDPKYELARNNLKWAMSQKPKK